MSKGTFGSLFYFCFGGKKMLNYWVALGLAVILGILGNNIPFIKEGFRVGIDVAVAKQDLDALRRINANARWILVFVWASCFYITACIVKFIISWF